MTDLERRVIRLESILRAAARDISAANNNIGMLAQSVASVRSGAMMVTNLAVVVDVTVFGVIPNDTSAPLGTTGMPQCIEVSVDVYLRATNALVGSGTTGASGSVSITCIVDPLYVTGSG
ncbi:MAG: hypothetical protein KGM43_06325, partial [Planctomycetota bacterium]|nr:hypothetical protein [Planctomycetota bacterium]